MRFRQGLDLNVVMAGTTAQHRPVTRAATVVAAMVSGDEPIVCCPMGEDRNRPLDVKEGVFQVLFGMRVRCQVVIVLVADAELEETDRVRPSSS